ncbi:MAG TPA: helix-turn-helix domain-containing protein [Solirubrobacterales bacterium]|nr:helix-turn-helix domain-containing protein [Solirubrobacterales bacterium]
MTVKDPTQALPSRRRRASPAVRRALRGVVEDIVVWRKLRGLTQTQLAERAGVGVNTVRRLEGGDGGVSIENVLSVLRVLGVLDGLAKALDPYESDIGRLRSEGRLPQRVRPNSLSGPADDG